MRTNVLPFLAPTSSVTSAPQPVSASGSRVTYTDGVTRVCATSGLWNTNLGYGDPVIADAVASATRELSYATLFRGLHPYAEAAASAVLDAVHAEGMTHLRRVAFATSGGACVDLALKIVRMVAAPRGAIVISLRGSYHGTTYGSSALTDTDLGQLATATDTRQVRHVSATGPTEFERLIGVVGPQVAGVVLEPVQGTGTHVIEPALVAAVKAARERYGFLLVADEVATGYGRTGPMFASTAWQPDLLVLSKGLTNGAATGSVVLMRDEVAETIEERFGALPWGETQAGMPATCAAITATLRRFRELDAIERGRALAAALDERLRDIAEPHGLTLTGRGLFRSILFDGVAQVDAAALVNRGMELGVRLQPGPNGVQVVPALTMSEADLHVVDDVLRTLVAESLSAAPAGVPIGCAASTETRIQ